MCVQLKTLFFFAKCLLMTAEVAVPLRCCPPNPWERHSSAACWEHSSANVFAAGRSRRFHSHKAIFFSNIQAHFQTFKAYSSKRMENEPNLLSATLHPDTFMKMTRDTIHLSIHASSRRSSVMHYQSIYVYIIPSLLPYLSPSNQSIYPSTNPVSSLHSPVMHYQ